MPSTLASTPARDGLVLATRQWPADPSAGTPWAAVLLVHGLGEHSGRYEHVGDELARAGLDVHAYDHRGFGASAGRRAWVRNWNDVYSDLGSRLESVRAASSGVPLVLYGHSLGALIALGYVLRGGRDGPLPNLLVLSAPGLEDNVARWKHSLARVLDRIVPGVRIANGIGREQLAARPQEGFGYGEDPLVENRSTVHFGAEAFAAQAAVRDAAGGLASMPIPTLVLHGGEDSIVPPSATEGLEGLRGVTRRLYPGFRHEIHNEADSPVIADMVAWLRGQIDVLGKSSNDAPDGATIG